MERERGRFLLAADIDGTLIARGNILAPPVRAAVREAMAHDIDVCLVTSRPLRATLPIHQELALATPLVCLGGAVIYEHGSLDVLMQHALPHWLLHEAHAITVSLDADACFYLRAGDRYAATSRDNPVIDSFVQRSGVTPEACAAFADITSRYRVAHRMGIIPSRRQLVPVLQQRMRAVLAGRANVVAHDGAFLSVIPAAATKLDALRHVCRRYRYEKPRVFAIGDSEDDRDMIEWSAFGVAMGNSAPALKQAADYVSPSVHEDGFSAAMRKLIERALALDPAPAERSGAGPHQGARLRYGENPFLTHAWVRRREDGDSAPPTSILDGHRPFTDKTLSYCNVADIDATVRMLWEFSAPTVVCSKHIHPAIMASGDTLQAALDKVIASGDSSIYGSVLACNRPIDAAITRALGDIFLSVVIAPSCTPEAMDDFAARRAKTQLLLLPVLGAPGARDSGPWRERRAIWGGELEQESRLLDHTELAFTLLGNTAAPLTATEQEDLRFGLKAVRYAKTNAAVVVRDLQTHAIANAQTTRYWAIELALQRSRERARGALLVCDGRFSHRDAFDLAASGGLGLIAAPRGLRAERVLDTWARERDVRLVLFPARLFHS